MPVPVTMPRLGESVTEGTVTRWLKQEGDRVEADEPLLEVSTDKVDTEIPSPAAGVLTRIVVHEDETADVGSELAVISDEGDGAADGGAAPAEASTAGNASAAETEAATETEPASATEDEAPAQQAAPAQQPAAVATEAGDGAGPSGGSASGPSTDLRMPALGESVTEGTVTRWLKAVGDSIEADEPLLEVSTDKVDTEIPSPVSGTLLEIKVGEDETVEVGAVLATIGTAGGAAAPSSEAPSSAATGQQAEQPAQRQQRPAEEQEPAPDRGTQPAQHAVADEAQPVEQQQPAREEPQPASFAPVQEPAINVTVPSPGSAPPPTGNGKVDGDESGYVTPLVRKLAAENGVNLAALSGTGVGGRIRKQDVLEAAERQRAAEAQAAAAASAPAAQGTGTAAQSAGGTGTANKAQAKPAPSPLRGRTEKLSRMRALIAKRMVESLQISAQLTTVVEVDVTRIARLRDQAKKAFLDTHGVKLTFLPFFALASVEALRVNPSVNASIDVEAGTVTYHDAEHLGIAVDSERGLLVAVVHNAGDLNLVGLAKRIADVAQRTRANKVTPDELSGGTFTLTNTGSRGALFDTPIINQPQVAILGTGAVVKRAVVVNDPELGEIIAPRSMVYLALSYDHRLVDGADAARFLTTVKDRLEGGNFEPELGL
jgi:pyruvate dehydrogenase E2 component (dihydrolipoamide acetyltransferase)